MTGQKMVSMLEHLWGAKGCVSHLSWGATVTFGIPVCALSWELSGYMSFAVSASYISDPNAKSTTQGHYVDL